MKHEIICAGIGGRGVLLASTILIEAAIESGMRAMASDEYGMSQRGGSVVSLVRLAIMRALLSAGKMGCASRFRGKRILQDAFFF